MPETTTDQTADQPIEAQPAGAADAQDTKPAGAEDVDWKVEARKWEKRAKDHLSRIGELEPKAQQFEALEEASRTELERAQAAAEAAKGSLAELRSQVVSAEVRAALTGVVPDPGQVIEDLNLSKFVGSDGSVNTDAISALRDKYAGFAAKSAAPKPNPAQGASANGPAQPSQLTRQDLAGMSPEAINEARKEGRLNTVLGITS